VGIHERFLHRGVVDICLAIYSLLHIEDGLLLRRCGHTEVDLGRYLRSCSLTRAIFDGNLLALLVDGDYTAIGKDALREVALSDELDGP